MNRTLHFKFPLYNNNDKPSILNDYNSTITEIDRVLYTLSIATGNSEEYERELEKLQEDVVDLTSLVNEHGEYLTEMSQTIATILGSVAALSTKVDGYDDRINTINTRLNNAYVALSKKFDTRTENDLPSQPIYDEENSVYYIKVPYVATTQDDTSIPQEMTPYLMNSSGFLWYGWRIIEFRIYKDNDESKEILYTTSLSPNDMVRPTIMKEVTYTYDEQTETDIESWFWVPFYNPIINVQTSIDNSTYSRINVPFNGRVTLSTATKGKKRVIRTVWFSNPCTIYWQGQEVNVEPYKLYHCFQDRDGTGWVTAIYGDDGGSGPDLSLYKMFSFENYLPASYGKNARKNNINSLLRIEFYDPHSSGISNLLQGEVSTNNLILTNVTPNECIQNWDPSYVFDNTKDRMALSPGGYLAQIPLVSEGLARDGKWFIKDNSERVLNDKVYIYACFVKGDNNVVKYRCNECIVKLDLDNTLLFQIGDVVCNGISGVPDSEQIPNESTGVYFELRVNQYSAYWLKMITDNPILNDMVTKTYTSTVAAMLWRFGYE